MVLVFLVAFLAEEMNEASKYTALCVCVCFMNLKGSIQGPDQKRQAVFDKSSVSRSSGSPGSDLLLSV